MDYKIDPRIITGSATIAKSGQNRNERDLKSLRESSRAFESLFIAEMFKEMRKAVPDGGLIEKDNATEIYQEMLDGEFAKTAASGKGLGLGEAMFEQMSDLIAKRKE